MKRISILMAAVGLIAFAGCQSSKTETAGPTKPDVMDLNDSPPAPIAHAAPAPMPADAPVEAAGPKKHTVVAKDTLYSLAKTYYGDSKQWKKIADANPGLVPEKMPVGKTIVIP